MRVVIAEDQVLLREGLARLFVDGGHDVVAKLGDADLLEATLAAHQPDLVVIDIRMPPTFTDEGARAALRNQTAAPAASAFSCCPNTRDDLRGRSGRPAPDSATCSRTASSRSASSSPPRNASPMAVPRSTPKSSPG